ncbi:MAG TPA: hypothetical protein VMZ50_04355, partial [Phycisphaerae bacterium]|nr:hypothetical protein [Phycisphaerae bacterium]
AKTFRDIAQATKGAAKKCKELQQLIQKKLGMKVPPWAMMGPGSGAPIQIPGSQILYMKNRLKFEQVGDTITAGPPSGPKTTFVKVGDDWKIQYSPLGRKMLAVLKEMTEGMDKAADAMTDGVGKGTITKDNLEEKANEIIGQTLQPARDKMANLMQEMFRPPGM